MDIITLILLMPFVLVVEGAVLGYAWTHPRGSLRTEQASRVLRALYGTRWGLAVLVGAWLLMTAVAFVYEFFVAIIVLYGLLFTGGRIAGWLALILLGLMFVSTPGICGWLLVRVGRHYRSPGGPRRPALAGMERRGQALPSA
jgi:hypothetical protein